MSSALQNIIKPPKSGSASSSVAQQSTMPSLRKDDFNALGDDNLQNYLKTIPTNEWIPLARYLMVGLSAASLSGLMYVMGQYTQWLKENKGKSRVKPVDSKFSSRAGAAIGRNVARFVSAPESVVTTLKDVGKAVGFGARKAVELFRSTLDTEPKSWLDKVKHTVKNIREFRRN